MPDPADALSRYYARLDGAEDGDPMDVVAEEIEVAFNVPGLTFRGGRAELQRYIDERDRSARTHHLVETATFGRSVLALGEARRGDEVLGTFIVAAEADDGGRLTRYLVTYELGMTFSTTKTGT